MDGGALTADYAAHALAKPPSGRPRGVTACPACPSWPELAKTSLMLGSPVPAVPILPSRDLGSSCRKLEGQCSSTSAASALAVTH